MRLLYRYKAACTTAIFVIVGFSNTALAGTINLSPESGRYSVGQIITANIQISSPGQAVNAASGILEFPKNKLQIVNLSKVGSVMSLWVQEPSYSNEQGTVDFAGVVLNPGFTGSSGKVLSVSFKVIGTGTAKITYPSGSLLANDGNGTDVLQSLGSAEYTLVAAAPAPPKPSPSPIIPSPVVSVSPTPVAVVTIEPSEVPIIRRYTEKVTKIDPIVAFGTTESDSTVRMYAEVNGANIKVAESNSDGQGTFTISWDQGAVNGLTPSSLYTFRFDAVNRNGKTTGMSSPILVEVRESLGLFGQWIMWVALILLIVASLVLVIAIIIFVNRKKKICPDIKQDLKKARTAIHDEFGHLHKNLDDYAAIIESANDAHKLTKEEEIMVKRMERGLDDSEHVIDERVEHIGENNSVGR